MLSVSRPRLLRACLLLLTCIAAVSTGFSTNHSPSSQRPAFFCIYNGRIDHVLRRRPPHLSQRHGRTKLLPILRQARYWEGDDIRWSKKMRRRFTSLSQTRTPAKLVLIILNVAAFLYQVINAVNHLRRKHPAYWPSEAGIMISDVVLGTSILGPFTMDFVHSISLSKRQPHRYLTAGFLHGGVVHLLVNMNSLWRTPSWLETGLGWPLFVTTFLVGIITGNMGHTSWSTMDHYPSLCLGASGGICALYGLLFVSLTKMGNTQLGSRVLWDMALILLYGFMFTNISNAAHVGGFLGGVALGILCSPSYRKSYSLTRKNSLEVDVADRQYRLAMGYGKVPTRRGLVPLSLVWGLAVVAFVANPRYQRIPKQIYQGLVRPGSLSFMQ